PTSNAANASASEMLQRRERIVVLSRRRAQPGRLPARPASAGPARSDMTSRRDVLKTLATGAAVVAWPFPASAWPQVDPATTGANGWRQLPQILARIEPPTFPARDFDVLKFGAVGDNRADNTEAFRAAIAACTNGGGGRVVVPAGEF